MTFTFLDTAMDSLIGDRVAAGVVDLSLFPGPRRKIGLEERSNQKEAGARSRIGPPMTATDSDSPLDLDTQLDLDLFLPTDDVFARALQRFEALPARGFPTPLDLASVLYCSFVGSGEVKIAAQVRLVLHGLPSVFGITPERLAALKTLLRAHFDGHPDQAPEEMVQTINRWFVTPVADEAARADRALDVAGRLSALVPPGLSLDPHQVAMVAEIERAGFRFLVADDQGVGKTAEALGAVLLHPKPFPLLVVTPSAVIHTWRRECERWLAGRVSRVHTLESGDRIGGSVVGMRPRGGGAASGPVVVTSWSLLAREPNRFVDRYAGVIFDESHYLASPTSQRSRAALLVRRETSLRLLLSGTPSPNGRSLEYYMQLKVLDLPVGPIRDFSERYGGPETIFAKGRARKGAGGTGAGASGSKPEPRRIRVYSGRSHEVEFADRFMRRTLRRMKTEVFPDLPKKTRYATVVPLTAADRMALATAREDVQRKLEERLSAERAELVARGISEEMVDQDLESRRGALAAQLSTELRIRVGEIKARWLPELLDDRVVERNRRVVVFGYHERVIGALLQALRKKKYSVVVGSSDLDAARRDEVCASFCAGEGDVLVLTSAYAEGITLLSASHPIDEMVALERLWVPGKEQQQEDRIHRRGQTLPVTYWYPIIPGSIDDVVGEVETWKESGQQTLRGSIGTRVMQWLGALPGKEVV